jgi:hypothetical protein
MKDGNRLTTLLFYGLLFIGLALYLLAGAFVVTAYDTDVAGVESNVVYSVQRFMHTGELYGDPEKPPYAITQYAPLYYIMFAQAASLAGIRPGIDVYEVYVTGRSLSFAFALLSATVVFLICWNRLRLRLPVCIAVTTVAFTISIPWYFIARPDALLSFLTFAAVWFFLLFLKQRNIYSLLFSAVLATMAALTKQNGIMVALAMGSFLLLGRNLAAVVYFAAGIVLTFIGFYVLSSSVHTPFVLDNVLKGVNNGISFSLAFANVYNIYITQYGFVLALVVGIAAHYYTGFVTANKQVLFLVYLFILLTVSTFGFALKVGSAIVYVYDSVIVGGILIGFFYDLAASQNDRSQVLPVALAVLVVLLSLNAGFSGFRVYGMYQLYGLITSSDVRNPASYDRFYNQQSVIRFMRHELKTHPGSLFFSSIRNVNNHLFEYCVIFQYDIAIIAFQRHIFSYRLLHENVQTGRLRYLVLKKGEAPSQLLGVDLSGYQHYKSLEGCDVYINPR